MERKKNLRNYYWCIGFILFFTSPGLANQAPEVNIPIQNQQTPEGDLYNFTFPENTFTDPDLDPLTYSATLADDSPLPQWLDFDGPSRTFTGTPSYMDVEMLTIKVMADDGNGGEVADEFVLEIEATTAEIPDPVFLNYLKETYPATINIDDRLIIAEAGFVEEIIIQTELAIENLIGVEFFINLKTFIINTFAQAIDPPDLTKLVKLETLVFFSTPLTNLPNLSNNTNLKEFECTFCELSESPDFSNNVELLKINISFNNTTEFPELSNNIKLEELYLDDNVITEVPDISMLQDLQILSLSSNLISEFSSLSNSELRVLNCSFNELSMLPNLDQLLKLEVLDCSWNNLTELPDLSNHMQLELFNCGNNSLTFEDLQILNIDSYIYGPQAPIYGYAEYYYWQGESVLITIDVDAGLEDNIYSWFLDYQPVSVAMTDVNQLMVYHEGT